MNDFQISSLQTEEQKPLRFTDSPTHAAYAHASSSSGYGHSAPPLSAASDHLADLYHNYRENFPPHDRPHDRPHDPYYRGEPYAFERTADYVVKHPYYGYDECAFDYREPTEFRQFHRRTPSNSSATNSQHEQSEFSPSRQYREKYPNRSEARKEYPRKANDYSLPRDYYADDAAGQGLEIPAKLRSSLKKYKKNASGGSTPTNPTPPESLSETDSSYVSARDASSGSARVRFSPEAMSDRKT